MAKVLFVVPHMKYSLRLLADYLRYLDPAFEVTVLVMSNDLTIADEFPPRTRFITIDDAAKKTNLPGTLRTFYRQARLHDLVVCWAELTPLYLTALASFAARRPIIGWIHTNISRVFELGQRPKRAHTMVMKFFYPHLVATVGCCKEVGDDLRDTYGLANAMSITNGIDVDRVLELSAAPIPEQFRHIFDEPVVVNVAALHYQKAQEYLLRAHKLLLERGVRHRLLLIGDGPLREEREAMVRELGITSTVFFAGYVANPWPLMKASQVFCLSSRFEGYALVVAEALAMGVPVVSTDCHSGPREILADGKYGTLVPIENAEKLADALGESLTDPALRQQRMQLGLEGARLQDIRLRTKEMEALFWRALKR